MPITLRRYFIDCGVNIAAIVMLLTRLFVKKKGNAGVDQIVTVKQDYQSLLFARKPADFPTFMSIGNLIGEHLFVACIAKCFWHC